MRLAPVADWLAHERLSEEFSAMGFYLSGHPLDAYEAALKRLGAVSYRVACWKTGGAPASRPCSPAR